MLALLSLALMAWSFISLTTAVINIQFFEKKTEYWLDYQKRMLLFQYRVVAFLSACLLGGSLASFSFQVALAISNIL